MQLTVGEKAPDFEAQTLRGQPIQLSDYHGKPVWLAFFRFASCPLCNLRVHELVNELKALNGHNLEMLGVFQSPPEMLERYVAQQDPPFTLIADPEMNLYKKYGLSSSIRGATHSAVFRRAVEAKRKGFRLLAPIDGPRLRVPADFLIDAQGFLRRVHYGQHIADHISISEVRGFLTELAA